MVAHLEEELPDLIEVLGVNESSVVFFPPTRNWSVGTSRSSPSITISPPFAPTVQGATHEPTPVENGPRTADTVHALATRHSTVRVVELKGTETEMANPEVSSASDPATHTREVCVTLDTVQGTDPKETVTPDTVLPSPSPVMVTDSPPNRRNWPFPSADTILLMVGSTTTPLAHPGSTHPPSNPWIETVTGRLIPVADCEENTLPNPKLNSQVMSVGELTVHAVVEGTPPMDRMGASAPGAPNPNPETVSGVEPTAFTLRVTLVTTGTTWVTQTEGSQVAVTPPGLAVTTTLAELEDAVYTPVVQTNWVDVTEATTQGTPPASTEVAPEVVTKLVPTSVTNSPPDAASPPEVGSWMEVTTVPVYRNEHPPEGAVQTEPTPDSVTTMGPTVPAVPAPVVQLICVAETKAVELQATPTTVTVDPAVNPAPVMTTVMPPWKAPALGEIPDTTGAIVTVPVQAPEQTKLGGGGPGEGEGEGDAATRELTLVDDTTGAHTRSRAALEVTVPDEGPEKVHSKRVEVCEVTTHPVPPTVMVTENEDGWPNPTPVSVMVESPATAATLECPVTSASRGTAPHTLPAQLAENPRVETETLPERLGDEADAVVQTSEVEEERPELTVHVVPATETAVVVAEKNWPVMVSEVGEAEMNPLERAETLPAE